MALLTDVGNGSHKLEVARGVARGASCHTDKLDGTVGQLQAMLKIKTLTVTRRPVDLLLHRVAVLRMNSREDKFHRRIHIRIALKDSEGLVRPEYLPAGNLPSQAAGVAESLGFGQVGFAPSELLGQELVLSDVYGAADALFEALAVARRNTDATNIADLAIGSHDALGGVEGRSFRHESVHQICYGLLVLWVDET